MAMSHELCTHPRTPAGRAACRKAGGPGAYLSKEQADTAAAAILSGTYPHLAAAQLAEDELKRAQARPAPKAKRVRANVPTVDSLPRLFRTAVDWALAHNCTVAYRTGRNASTMVVITGGPGELTLTYADATPEGVNAVSWRPVGSSVATRLTDVNSGLAKLK